MKITKEELRKKILNGEDITKIDYSHITDMSNMFEGCIELKKLDYLDTSNVINMFAMFSGCENLQEICLLDTSKVKDMQDMFHGCLSLKKIPQLNTQNVENMDSMFSGSAIEEITYLNTKSVKNMASMFAYCMGLKIVKLDTINVESMSNMFAQCRLLKEVEFNNTSKVKDMSFMFYNVNEEVEVNFKNWDFDKKIAMWEMIKVEVIMNKMNILDLMKKLIQMGRLDNYKYKALELAGAQIRKEAVKEILVDKMYRNG